jgi:hypothetical protein
MNPIIVAQMAYVGSMARPYGQHSAQAVAIGEHRHFNYAR